MSAYKNSLSVLEKLEEEYSSIGNSVMAYAYKEYSNRHFRPYMEDGHKIIDPYIGDSDQGYFSIFDGHGGKESMLYCKDRLHEELEKHIRMFPNDIKCALVDSFESIDQELQNCGHVQVGTTATVALIRKEKRERVLYLANVGDSSAVLVSNTTAEIISYDHKATDRLEMARVQNSGGTIFRGRLRGTLALTRSLGDHMLKSSGLSAEPTVTRIVLTPCHTMVVLASDGLWDVVSPTDLLAYKNFEPLDIASELIRYAVKCGSQDNISVIVISL